ARPATSATAGLRPGSTMSRVGSRRAQPRRSWRPSVRPKPAPSGGRRGRTRPATHPPTRALPRRRSRPRWVCDPAARTAPADALVARPVGRPVRDLMALRSAGIRLGAVTNVQVMGEAEVRALLAPIGLNDLLEVVVTSTAVGAEKPDPRGILHALESLGIAA